MQSAIQQFTEAGITESYHHQLAQRCDWHATDLLDRPNPSQICFRSIFPALCRSDVVQHGSWGFKVSHPKCTNQLHHFLSVMWSILLLAPTTLQLILLRIGSLGCYLSNLPRCILLDIHVSLLSAHWTPFIFKHLDSFRFLHCWRTLQYHHWYDGLRPSELTCLVHVVRVLDTTKTRETLREVLKGDSYMIWVSRVSFIKTKS